MRLPRIRRGAESGEIRDDAFAGRLETVAADPSVRTILEIGSASGAGSTAAFARGLARNPGASLYCLEALPERFSALQRRYADRPRIHPINASSVGVDGFADESEVRGFQAALTTALSRYPVDEVLQWRAADLRLVASGAVATNGIELARDAAGVEAFDAVLIDGSEFTGRAELDAVIGSRILLLDDVNSFKNHFNCQRLLADARYELVDAQPNLRNGYAVFTLSASLPRPATSPERRV